VYDQNKNGTDKNGTNRIKIEQDLNRTRKRFLVP
jgi:hypothetical protein